MGSLEVDPERYETQGGECVILSWFSLVTHSCVYKFSAICKVFVQKLLSLRCCKY